MYDTIYDHFPSLENAIISNVVNTAFGEAGDLVKELGIQKEDLDFQRISDLAKDRDRKLVD